MSRRSRGAVPRRDWCAGGRRAWHRWKLMRSGIRIAVVGVTIGVLSSCTGAPDRESEARRLKDALEAVPGVDSTLVTYSNSFTLGPTIAVTVRMGDATIDQIESAASRIADSYRHDFSRYRQSASFWIGSGTVEYRSDNVARHVALAPEVVAADVRAVRRIRSAMPDPPSGRMQITWLRTAFGPELTLQGGVVGAELAAVRAAVGENPVLVRIIPVPRRTAIAWTVEFPFRSEDEDEVRRIVSRLPLNAMVVTVSAGHISELRVEAPDAADAYARLVSVIDVAVPTAEHPMMLKWDAGRVPGAVDRRRFRGSVHVGGCSYDSRSGGEMEPGRHSTDDAIAVQKRLRDEYDTCR